MEKLIIGSHVSFKKDSQLLGSLEEALSYDANTFMIYTGAPQNTNRVPIDDSLTYKALLKMKEKNIDLRNIIVHAPYIINPANSKNLDFAISFLTQEIERTEKLGLTKLVLHPGSHVNLGEEVAITNIIHVLNNCIRSDTKVSILLETMAGKGSEIGKNFNELARIINGVVYKEKVQICLDTCHLNDSGYDLKEFNTIIKEFDEKIGINKIGCIHINDSKNTLNAHKDRHENFGFGTIGFDTLINIIYHESLKNVPKILETPYIPTENKNISYPPYKFEIEMIKNKIFNPNLKENIKAYYK
ncbi:MAG: deoxyribonuclease IV [Bacilli bacterium]